jgi:hypothetical protein
MRRRSRPLARFLVSTAAVLLLSACRADEQAQALSRIEEARKKLAGLARHGRTGFARDSIALARQSLLEAEAVVRREGPFTGLFADAPEWEAPLKRALDGVGIAEWVVERERNARVEEAEAWIRTAGGVVDRARRSGLDGVHFAVASRLRRAQASVNEARRLLSAEEFGLAVEKAREASQLAGELPPETEALFARFGDPRNLGEWRTWAKKAIAESRRTRRAALVVDKRAQTAVLWRNARPTRWFAVELGYNGLNRKLRAGDGATPEGSYRVVRRKGPGETRYYKALLLDYPNAEDRRRFQQAKKNGEIAKGSAIGGLIEIHGDGGRGTNWTDGCVAVSNEEMDYLFEELAVGSTVVIVGSYDGMGRGENSR